MVLAGAGTVCGAPEDGAVPVRSPILSTDVSGSDIAFFSGAAHGTALLLFNFSLNSPAFSLKGLDRVFEALETPRDERRNDPGRAPRDH